MSNLNTLAPIYTDQNISVAPSTVHPILKVSAGWWHPFQIPRMNHFTVKLVTTIAPRRSIAVTLLEPRKTETNVVALSFYRKRILLHYILLLYSDIKITCIWIEDFIYTAHACGWVSHKKGVHTCEQTVWTWRLVSLLFRIVLTSWNTQQNSTLTNYDIYKEDLLGFTGLIKLMGVHNGH